MTSGVAAGVRRHLVLFQRVDGDAPPIHPLLGLRRHLVPQGRGRRVAVVPYPVVVADGVWRATSVVAVWPH
jgi:hypothetical protein